jgi:hypothetical protein
MSFSGLKPLQASLAIAAFVALMTWNANSIHLPFVLFPELGALGLVIFSDRHQRPALRQWILPFGLLVIVTAPYCW